MKTNILFVVTFFAFLTVAKTSQAIPVLLEEFVIFSGDELHISGHSLVYGNIGSNADYDQTGNSQILGSVVVGGNLDIGSNVAFGSDGILKGPDVQQPTQPIDFVYSPSVLSEIVVNGSADFGGGDAAPYDGSGDASRIYGNVYTNDVFLHTNVVIREVTGVGGNLEYTGDFDWNSGADVEGLVNSSSWGPATSGSLPLAPGPLGSTQTFGGITMPAASDLSGFTVTQGNQAPTDNNPGTELTLLPNTILSGYGALTTAQSQVVNLQSGDYYFQSLDTGGGLTLNIDLSSGAPINIYVIDSVTFGQDTVLKVKGPGDSDFISIDQRPELALLINWETPGQFYLGGGDANAWTTIFGGIVYSTRSGTSGITADNSGINIRQHVDWYGSLYTYGDLWLADHSRFNYVTTSNGPDPIPEPSTLLLLSTGLISMVALHRRKSHQ